ncbi:MAG TPA: SDR family NAD(P)-dependent oxidoreductase [Longimicrobium sp.]|jgi:NADP-dependent 3-hydroxy acid dehydrogenase YdfG|uniref:SDR family oxidoreductase n=1 Tax=Longimicrobium sp. TaxID=2029185 RepID=UPI002EDBA1EF
MSGRVVVITGASGGIGAAVARRLGAEGASVVLAARRREELEAVAAESGASALAVPTDVTVRAQVEALRDAAVERFGRVDVWINNAGRGITRPALEVTDEDLDEMMTINVRSALYGMQAIVPHFVERGSGHLINVSSFLGRVPIATQRSAYNAAKAALNALTANLRVDLADAHPGIHVSLVMPGVVLTEFAANARGGPIAGGPPPGPMKPQTAEEVAEVIAGVIAAPRADVYTNPVSPEMARRYYDDVEAFEAQVRAARAAVPR